MDRHDNGMVLMSSRKLRVESLVGVAYHCQIQTKPSNPETSRVSNAIETFGEVVCATSAQHVDMRESNQSRDHV